MPIPSTNELKRVLRSEGFSIYRSSEDRLVLAERVRENLIMDAGVVALLERPARVQLTTRAQSSVFPGDSPEQLESRARALGEPARSAGYAETTSAVVQITDPGDPGRTLDVVTEVVFVKAVASLAELLLELRFAVGLEKIASPRRG
ncbi:MAG: hypothetical protein IT376_01245 [Polyangiaceae bacterium]|nr:hypothetical protein [Polyangiaceae bacterium]